MKALWQIWADVHIAEILVEKNKSSKVFKLFSNILKKCHYCTVDQCWLKVKNLQLKVCDVLWKSDSSSNENIIPMV